jgi:hypothetical protein
VKHSVEARVLQAGDIIIAADGTRQVVLSYAIHRGADDVVTLQLQCVPTCEGPCRMGGHPKFSVPNETRFMRETT